jgi:hypothetical protein
MEQFVVVEPLDGSELDRLITALLNATGTVRQVIERTEQPPGLDGEQIIGVIARRLSAALAPIAEHYDDEELAVVTGVIAHTALLIASDLGLEGVFGMR